jgi:hypothetical protein
MRPPLCLAELIAGRNARLRYCTSNANFGECINILGPILLGLSSCVRVVGTVKAAAACSVGIGLKNVYSDSIRLPALHCTARYIRVYRSRAIYLVRLFFVQSTTHAFKTMKKPCEQRNERAVVPVFFDHTQTSR